MTLVRAICLVAIGSLGLPISSQAQSGSAPRDQLALNANVESTRANTVAKNADLIAPVLVKAEAVANVDPRLALSAHDAAILASANTYGRELNAAINGAVPVSLVDENILKVKVDYDPRPVGGILSVRISIGPAFRGVGVSARPAISRSVALAVDELSEEMVRMMVDDLTEEVRAEFTTFNAHGSEAHGFDGCPEAELRK